MNDEALRAAMSLAAAALAGRRLTCGEETDLYRTYCYCVGSPKLRATRAISEATFLSPAAILRRRALNENADAAMRQLEELLEQRRPED